MALFQVSCPFIGKSGIHCPNSIVILDALHRFRDTNCDFFDCYLAAMFADSGHAVASFEHDFRKFPDIALWK